MADFKLCKVRRYVLSLYIDFSACPLSASNVPFKSSHPVVKTMPKYVNVFTIFISFDL